MVYGKPRGKDPVMTARERSHPALPAIALVFLAGVCVLQIQPDLSLPIWSDASLTALLPLCLWLFYRCPSRRLILALCIGYLWALLFAHHYLQQRLPEDMAGDDFYVQGRVVDVVAGYNQSGHKQTLRFNFLLESYLDKSVSSLQQLPRKVRISWYSAAERLWPGELWRLKIRLKPPHGMLNPGGFDYEKWLYQQGIHATGYVRNSKNNQRISAGALNFDRLRQQLNDQLAQIGDGQYKGLLQALTTGYKSNISPQQWQVMLVTGTSHLMAISGLHIGLVAGMVFFLGARIVPVCALRRLSKQQLAAVMSLMAAGLYAALAGFSIPTQRAFVMLLVMLLAVVFRRPAFSLNTLSISLIAVLLVNPASSVTAGFWLSFSAVLLIGLMIGGQISTRQRWLQGIRLQWLIALSMLPLTLLLFQQASLLAPLANMLMIPLVGFVVVPLLLLGSLLSLISVALAHSLYSVANEALALGWQCLGWLSALPGASWQSPGVPFFYGVLALLGGILLISPRGFPLKPLGTIMLLPVLLFKPARPLPGDFSVQILDVGQGLSVLVQTHAHTLLYDVGAKQSERFDMGKLVVVPSLRFQGIDELDLLILSHKDNDHAGGANEVLDKLKIKQLYISGIAEDYRLRRGSTPQVCEAGQQWVWDEVHFQMLHPQADQTYHKTNNQSCVLKVSNQFSSLLLTGDIEQRVEQQLLQLYQAELQADVILVPHHGSNTSSSLHWLQQIEPTLAIVSAGYMNRFRHPTAKVATRYHAEHVKLLNTARQGGISLRFKQQENGALIESQSERKDASHYWNHRL